MKLNILHSILLLVNILLGSVVAFDWTSLGISQASATTVAGIVVMVSAVVTGLLNATGNSASGVAAPKK